MRTLLALALVLVACGRSDRPSNPAAANAPSASASQGPDPLAFRVPRAGGVAHVYAYPRLDTTLWSSSRRIPAVDRVLAFDADAGSIAYEDDKGRPVRVDLRLGGSDVAAPKGRLASLASSDGDAIYGIARGGVVVRLTPAAQWTFKPPAPARELFPQPDGSLLILGDDGDQTDVWHLHPPDTRIYDTTQVPRVERAIRSLVGDRLYLAVDSGLLAVRSRDLSTQRFIRFDHPVVALAPTPSGDRLFVAMRDAKEVDVVDRYRDKVAARVQVPGEIADLRMDPLGRYVLAHLADQDSAVVIAIGTDHLVGTIPTAWRADLPAVAPDGAIAVVDGKDVRFVDGETLRPTRTIGGAATDYWYFFRWDGFRPRAAGLDQPVTFPVDSADSARFAESAAAVDSGYGSPFSGAGTPVTATQPPLPASPPPVRRDTMPRPSPAAPASPAPAATHPGFIVSFAAFLAQDRAREEAAKITVDGQQAHVLPSPTAGTTIYRVVLGPYATRAEAVRIGKDAHRDYWIFEGAP